MIKAIDKEKRVTVNKIEMMQKACSAMTMEISGPYVLTEVLNLLFELKMNLEGERSHQSYC